MTRYESQKTEERKSFLKKNHLFLAALEFCSYMWTFSELWLAGDPHCCGFSCCGAQAQQLWHMGLFARWHVGFQFPDGNQMRKHLHWQVDSYPLHHQGSLRKDRFLKAAFESLDLATPKPNLGVFNFLNKSSQFFFFFFQLKLISFEFLLFSKSYC